MRPLIITRPLLAMALIATAACGSAETPAADDPPATAQLSGPAVAILSPADGDTVTQPFLVTLGATGVEVVAATGQREEGKGHHHLVLGDVATDDAVPLGGPPSVIHLGTGATERMIDSLPSGPLRIVAIFAWGDHVPMAGVRRDTITVVVR